MIRISEQFKGPPASANGGYISGVMADQLCGPGFFCDPVEISLKAPPPLETDLTVQPDSDGLCLMEDQQKIATVKALDDLELDIVLPARTAVGQAMPVATGFGTCFVCGEKRTAGDGLCIHTCPRLDGSGIWQGDFHAHPAFCNADGFLERRYCFAALDCPGYASIFPGELAVLARFRVCVSDRLFRDEKAVVTAWPLEPLDSQERKRLAGTALFGADQRLIAKAEALWIKVDKSQLRGLA